MSVWLAELGQDKNLLRFWYLFLATKTVLRSGVIQKANMMHLRKQQKGSEFEDEASIIG